MAGEWREMQWGDIVTLEYGKSLRGYKAASGPFRVYGTNGPIGWTDEALCPHPTVIIGRKGAYRGVHYSPAPCFVIDTAFYLKQKTDFNMRWAYYQLRTHDIDSMDSGSAIPSTSRPEFYQLPVHVPPVPEQQAIACILGALDDKIDLNRRMNETLEAIAQAIFKSWFVDFDPVRAKAAGQQPAGLAPEIAELFPDEFQETKDGEVPNQWFNGRLGDLTGFLGGFAFKSKDWLDEGVPVVKIGSVKPGIVDLKEVSFVSEEIAEKVSRFRLNPGDLLIGMTGYVGEVGLVPPTDNPPLLNQRVGKFLLEKDGTEALGYIYCLTRQPDFKVAVETKSHGTAQANVSADGILSILVIIPPKPLRDAFNRFGHPILDRILSNHGESSTLSSIRDSLLPKLISGELRVPDAERIVGRCA